VLVSARDENGSLRGAFSNTGALLCGEGALAAVYIALKSSLGVCRGNGMVDEGSDSAALLRLSDIGCASGAVQC
jgi:hypothetical protein